MKTLILSMLLSTIFTIGILYGQNEDHKEKNIEYIREEIQDETTENHFFKLLIGKDRDQDYEGIKGVKIFEKENNKLIQEIELDCMYLANALSVSDYNFDGFEDFSVFEAFYAGPNTTHLYILWDPDKNEYFVSDIYGVSLEFDSASKTVSETNQCCAGSVISKVKYKVDENILIPIKKQCFIYNENTDEMEERPFAECE